MPKTYKDPPAFSKAKSYSRWKTEVNMWADMVKLNNSVVEDTIGQIVALNSLPDNESEGDIRGQVLDALGDSLKGKEGLKKLLDWMDEHLGRDEIQTCVDKASSFMKYRRAEGQTIKEYLANFDARYKAAVGAGLGDMGQIFLMYMVIEHAGVSDNEFQLVLSQIDFEAKDKLYEQAKAGMVKFMAGINSKDKKDEGIKFKDSSTFFAKIPWKPKTPYQPRFPMRGGNQTPNFGGAGAFNGARKNFKPRTPIQVPRNPIRNGKQELCDICGAWSHFRKDCPHNPNVHTMMGVIEDDENEDGYLYHGDNVYVSEQPEIIDSTESNENGDERATDHVSSLIASLTLGDKRKGKEVMVLVSHILNTETEDTPHGQVVLDTGCVKTVSSTKWLNTFISRMHPATREKIKVEPSDKVFKFGGGQRRKSVGTFYVPCSLEDQNLVMIIDAVEQDDLPCLLSKESMKKAGVIINVYKDEATIFDKQIKLKENAAGHYVISLDDYKHGQEEWAVMWLGDGKDEDQVMKDL